MLTTRKMIWGNEVERKHSEVFKVLGNSPLFKLEAGHESFILLFFYIFNFMLFHS